MNLTRVSQMYIPDNRFESVGHFATSFYDDTVTLLTSSAEDLVFELIYEPDSYDTIPHMVSYIKTPQDRPLDHFIQPINLENIYEQTKNILQLQEFVMDPLYVNKCSTEPVKPALTHSFLAPNTLQNNDKLLAVLNNYGACFLLSKSNCANKWEKKVTNITDFLLNKIFPVQKRSGPMKTYNELKELIATRCITCIAWDALKSEHILFVSTAVGLILALKLNEETMTLEEYARQPASIGRVALMKINHDFLFMASEDGIINLYKINRQGNASLIKVSNLWSKADRISCHLCEIIECESLNAFIIVFCKAATLLVCIVNGDGLILAKNRIRIDEIKITGLISLNAFEYVVSTITGNMYRIYLSVLNEGNFQLNSEIIETDMDSRNFQILGLAATRNHNLFTVLMYRNKEYTTINKKQKTSIILETYTHVSIDVLQQLIALDTKTFDAYKDFAVKIRLDLLNNNSNAIKYVQFNKSLNDIKYCVFNDHTLKLLQIKHIILNALCQYENLKYYAVRKQTIFELNILKYCIEITHIICRLEHLSKQTSLNEFQQLSTLCMLKRFNVINQSITELMRGREFQEIELSTEKEAEAENNKLKSFIINFVEGAFIEIEKLSSCLPVLGVPETCLQCNEIIDNEMVCPNAHKLQRCCISYLQVSYFNNRFCFNCNVPAISNKIELQSLFTSNEIVKCTFCRFSLSDKDL